jgi:hypothetical protein
MDAALRAAVRERAAECCEFCQRRQAESPLQIEHIIPRELGWADDLESLALGCAECNPHKGSNLTSIDPETSQAMRLFYPRHNRWVDNLAWKTLLIVVLTAFGRTTVRVPAPELIGKDPGLRGHAISVLQAGKTGWA